MDTEKLTRGKSLTTVQYLNELIKKELSLKRRLDKKDKDKKARWT